MKTDEAWEANRKELEERIVRHGKEFLEMKTEVEIIAEIDRLKHKAEAGDLETNLLCSARMGALLWVLRRNRDGNSTNVRE